MSLVLCEGCRLAGTRPRVLHLFCLCREGENSCKSFRSKEAVEWICLPFSSCRCLPLEILVIFTCLLCLYLQNGHCAALKAPRDAGLGGGRCVLVCFPETCCLSSGRAAEGAQWPLCSVLSFMHCFHSSKNMVLGYSVHVLLPYYLPVSGCRETCCVAFYLAL